MTYPVQPVTPTDRSGSITTGGTAQNVMAANASRKGCTFQNISDTDMWVSEVGTAAADASSIKIGAGLLYEWPAHGTPRGAISVLCATTGKKFVAREW